MLVTNNAYLILGLSSDKNEKQINKRYKEILNLLSIDEVPSYDQDFPFLDYGKIRTESSVKSAFTQITNQKKKLYQTFFWFDNVDKEDEKAFNLLKDSQFVNALNLWKNLYDEKGKWHYLKNYLVLYLLLYENWKSFDDEFDFSNAPVELSDGFKLLIGSDKFWKEFKETYDINNEIALTSELLKSLKNDLPQYMVEAVFDISEQIKKQVFYKTFAKTFGLVARDLDDNVNVTKELDLIKKNFLNIQEFKYDDNINDVDDWIMEIEKAISRLDNLGLSDNPKLKKLRDSVASEVLNLAITVANDYDDYDHCDDFLLKAEKIAYSEALKKRIQENQDKLCSLRENSDGFGKNSGVIGQGNKIEDQLAILKKATSISTIKACYVTLKLLVYSLNGGVGGNLIKDSIAAAFYDRALYFNNVLKLSNEASDIINMADYFVCSNELKNKINNAQLIIKKNVIKSVVNSMPKSTTSKSTGSGGSNVKGWVIGIIVIVIIGLINAFSGNSSNNSYNNSSSSSYVSSYEKNGKCKGSDGLRYNKPVHAYCDGGKTALGWSCNNGYTAKSENNKTWLDSSWYCAANCKNFSCKSYSSYSSIPCTSEERAVPTNVNQYSQASVDNYNEKIEAYNRCLSEKCSCSD